MVAKVLKKSWVFYQFFKCKRHSYRDWLYIWEQQKKKHAYYTNEQLLFSKYIENVYLY